MDRGILVPAKWKYRILRVFPRSSFVRKLPWLILGVMIEGLVVIQIESIIELSRESFMSLVVAILHPRFAKS